MSIWKSNKNPRNLTNIDELVIYMNKIILKEINDLNPIDLNEESLKFPGIYILKILNNIKYIGSSRYLFDEIKQSIRRYEKKFKGKISLIDVYIINNYEDAEILEHYLISICKPQGNMILYKNSICFLLIQ